MKNAAFFIFCMIFVLPAAFCQKADSSRLLKISSTAFDPAALRIAAANNSFTQPVPANFYTSNFGFFCRKELQMEKSLKVPLKIRVGTVQQVDAYEGKPNSGALYRW